MRSEEIYSSSTNMCGAHLVSSTSVPDASISVAESLLVPADYDVPTPHLDGKTLRIVDDQLFVVDPGSPPSSDHQ